MTNQYRENMAEFAISGIRESLASIAVGMIIGAIMFYGATL